MSGLSVEPVVSWMDRRRFVDFAWSHYRHDPNWIPPLRGNQRELLLYRRHPFQGVGEVRTFLARQNGQVRGRVAAIVNRAHNETFGENRGFFGFFESVDDPQVAKALFDAARDWLRGKGLSSMRGPVNPSMNYECGLLVEGFDSPPTFMMTYNPPYYAQLIEGYGFRKSHDLLAYLGATSELPRVEKLIGDIADQAQERCNAIIRPLNTSRFMEDVEKFLDLYNRACASMWGFVPLSQGEVRQLGKSLRRLLVPELSLFAEVDGKGVGAVIGMPDYNPRIKSINGRLFPFGFMKLLKSPQGIPRIRVWSIAVVPEYQRWGLGLVLMRSLVPKALAMGVKEAEFSWVAESNTLANQGLRKAGGKVYKRYRIYDLDGAQL